MDVAELSIRVDSSGAVKGVTDLNKLTAAAANADRAVDRVGVASVSASPKVANLARQSMFAGNSARMMGMQLSQVGQQTMATGNFVQALAIQLPDIGLAFGVVGTAAGLLAGIALPLLVNAFADTGQSAKTMQDALDASAEAVAAYSKAANAALAPNEELVESYGRLSVAAGAALRAMEEIRRIEAFDALSASIKAVTGSLLEWEITGSRLGKATYGKVLADDFGLAEGNFSRLQAAIIALDSAKGLTNQAEAAAAVQRELFRAYGSIERMPPALRATSKAMAEIVDQAGGVQGGLEKSNTFAASLSAAAQNISFAAASVTASNLADRLGEAAVNAWEIAKANAAAFSAGREVRGLKDERGSQRTVNKGATNHFTADQPWRDTGGAAGAGGVDEFATKLAGLQQNLQTERQMVDAWYAESQVILADRRSQEILGVQGHKDAMLQIEKSYQDQIAAIEGDKSQQRLGDMSSFFGSLAGVAAAGGKGMVKAVATYQAVQSTIDAWGAYTKVINDPSFIGRPWARVAAGISVLGAGLKGVAAIRSAGGIGGGGGSLPSAPATQATQAQEAPAQRLIVQGLRASDLITGQMVYDMFMGESRLRGAPIVELLR